MNKSVTKLLIIYVVYLNIFFTNDKISNPNITWRRIFGMFNSLI